MKASYIPMLCFALFGFDSCSLVGMVLNGSTKIRFSIDEAFSRGMSPVSVNTVDHPRLLDSASLPNELIWIDASDPLATIKRATLSAGINELTLVKGGVHLVGFVYNPATARSLSRSMTSAILTVGNLQILTAGLDSVPLSTIADDTLELGQLEETGTGYGSTVDVGSISTALGYDETSIELFGTFDNTLMKFLNPDINSDGQFDQYQFFSWKFRAIPYVDLKKTDFDFVNEVMSPDFTFRMTDFQYVLDLSNLSGYPIRESTPELDDISMTLIRADGSTRSFSSNWVNNGQVYFRPTEYTESISDLPEDGAYYISLPKAPEAVRNLTITNAVFLKPNEGFIGLPFPIIHVTVNENRETTGIAWKWMIRDASGYRQASQEEVALNIRSMHFSWELRENMGAPIIFTPADYTVSGEASLTSFIYDSLVAENLQCLFIDCVDLGWNYYKFNYYMNGSDSPSQYGDLE